MKSPGTSSPPSIAISTRRFTWADIATFLTRSGRTSRHGSNRAQLAHRSTAANRAVGIESMAGLWDDAGRLDGLGGQLDAPRGASAEIRCNPLAARVCM